MKVPILRSGMLVELEGTSFNKSPVNITLWDMKVYKGEDPLGDFKFKDRYIDGFKRFVESQKQEVVIAVDQEILYVFDPESIESVEYEAENNGPYITFKDGSQMNCIDNLYWFKSTENVQT